MKLRSIIPGGIKTYIRKKVLQHDVGRYYYSQHGEDIIVRGILESYGLMSEHGFYVDVGAFHPCDLSNTLFFYANGWHGINIDARPESMILFNELRSRDINLEVGVSEKEAVLDYYYFGSNSPMNSFSKEFIESNQLLNSVNKIIQTKTYPLSAILDKYLPQNTPIDYMNIDVEGLDLEVINSNNWDKYRPKIISVEVDPVTTLKDVINSDVYRRLSGLNYECIAKNMVTHDIASAFFVEKNIINNKLNANR